MANSHHAHIYNTLEEYCASRVNTERCQRKARARWKAHIEKHGNVPLIEKCQVCSGREEKEIVERKYGTKREWYRSSKVERDEIASPPDSDGHGYLHPAEERLIENDVLESEEKDDL